MKLYKTFLFILTILALLALLCWIFPQPSILIGGVKLRFPTLSSVFDLEEPVKVDVDKQLATVEEGMTIQLVDSAHQVYLDSLQFYTTFFSENPSRFYCPNNDPTYFSSFFHALNNASQKMVHIMHYGDSQIEGDRISGFLRNQFQERFGGGGAGLIPLFQPIDAMSVGQSLSQNVNMYYAGGMMGDRATHRRYGAMAQVAELDAENLWLKIWNRNAKSFSRVSVFAGNIVDSLKITVEDESKILPSSFGKINCLTWNLAFQNAKTSLAFDGTSEIYGISLDDGKGVSLSNIPMRGSDGTFFLRIEPQGLQSMLSDLNTQLVILEFGGNAMPVFRDSVSVSRYCANFAQQIQLFKRLLPNVKILVIGPSDMSTKKNGELRTYPLLPYLVEQMKQTSTTNGAAYWDMYAVMGGYNSMIAWVNHSPQWAAPDYIHFTRKGADRIAQVLWQTFMIYYDYQFFVKP